MKIKHLWPLVCIFLMLMSAPSCGNGSSNVSLPPSKPAFLYAVTLSGPPSAVFQLATFKVDSSTGTLSSPTTTALPPLIVPQVAVDPASKFLYVSDISANAIDIFAIDPSTGIPAQTSAFVVTSVCGLCPPISGPGVLTLDPSGKFLFYGSSTLGIGMFEGVGALAVDSTTGALSGVPGSPFAADQAPFFVRVHPSGNFLYTENIDATGSGGVTLQSLSTFSIDSSTGVLAPAPGSPFTPPVSATIAGLAFHPSGRFLYAATGFAGNGVMAWSIDSITGGLTMLAGSPYQAGTLAFGTGTFDPSGKYLYVSAGAPGGILGFNVDANSGALTPLSGSPFASTSVVSSPVVEPGGRFLLASDTKNKAIVGFSLDSATGELTPLGSPTPSGSVPITLTIVKVP